MENIENQTMLDKHAEHANQTFQNIKKEISEISELNKELIASDAAYPVAGSAVIAVGLIWGNITIDVTYTSGEKVHFYGEHWGIGLTGAVIAVAGVFGVPAKELIGPCSYQITATSILTTIQLWNGKQFIGSITGAGFAVGSAVVGGSGKWTRS